MLLEGSCEVEGLKPDQPDACFVLWNRRRELTAVVGRPDRSAIQETLVRAENKGVVICAPENTEWLGAILEGWSAGSATLHLLKDSSRLPRPDPNSVRFIAADEIATLGYLPPPLLEELEVVAPTCLIAATLVDKMPMSFCYVAWETETLWDISIETLPGHRGKGHAGVAVSFLIGHMNRKGKQPVWGAEDSNSPSLKLAAKLGFVPVDRLTVFRK